MNGRALRRHQARAHMWRRLREDRNQHYEDLNCACYQPGKAMARFKEQPKLCSCWMCKANKRERLGPTIQERRAMQSDA